MRALLALFVRSLKEDVRGRSTYIVRAALVMLVLFFLWITHVTSSWSGAVGREFFTKVLWVDLFVLSVVGLSYFASAITEEKESDTLGLLRMTNLNALSILMGKSTGRLLGALFILTAQLPFMLVAVTMGGLAVQQVFAGFVCLLGYVILLSNIGLFCSVVAKRTSTATLLSGGIVFGMLVLPWWLYGSGQLAGGTPLEQWLDAWARATPFVHLKHVLWTGFGSTIFGWELAASLTAGGFFFGLAWLLFERCADPSDEKMGSGFAAPAPREMAPVPTRARRAKIPALRWKDYYHLAGGHTAVAFKVLAVAVIIFMCLEPFRIRRGTFANLEIFGSFATFFTTAFLAMCLALDAARIFKREREQQTLSSLITLPLSTRRIIWEKTVGCLKASWPAMIGVAIGLSTLGFTLASEISRQIAHGQSYWSRDLYFGVFFFFHAVFTFLLLPVYIAWLSLRVRWGALPIGITIWFLGNFAIGAATGLLAGEGAIMILPVISFCLLFACWQNLPGRLEQLAAEE